MVDDGILVFVSKTGTSVEVSRSQSLDRLLLPAISDSMSVF